jgi:hypothetical protein
MRAHTLSLTAFALTLTGACFAAHAVRGSGNLKTEPRSVADFEAVAVHAGIHAVVSLGDKSVEVRADDNILPLVRTEVRGNTLQIGFEPHNAIWSSGEVTVVVRTPRLRGLEASGGADIRAESSNGETLQIGASGGGHASVGKAVAREIEVRASGGATVEARAIDAEHLSANGSGGAVLRLSGRAVEAQLRYSGGTDIHAQDLDVGRLSVSGSGGGDAQVHVGEAVRGGLSGGTTLHVAGNPQRARVSTSGGAEVVYRDGNQGRPQRGRDHREDRDDDD